VRYRRPCRERGGSEIYEAEMGYRCRGGRL
jgi:hypothetical protein